MNREAVSCAFSRLLKRSQVALESVTSRTCRVWDSVEGTRHKLVRAQSRVRKQNHEAREIGKYERRVLRASQTSERKRSGKRGGDGKGRLGFIYRYEMMRRERERERGKGERREVAFRCASKLAIFPSRRDASSTRRRLRRRRRSNLFGNSKSLGWNDGLGIKCMRQPSVFASHRVAPYRNLSAPVRRERAG